LRGVQNGASSNRLVCSQLDQEFGDLELAVRARLDRSRRQSCRFGGEEFAIILPESAAQHAVARANHLREEVKQRKLQYNGQALGAVTVSLGIATFPEHGLTSDELLRVADRCLYQSKKSGRDVVTVAAHSAGAGVPAPAKQ